MVFLPGLPLKVFHSFIHTHVVREQKEVCFLGVELKKALEEVMVHRWIAPTFALDEGWKWQLGAIKTVFLVCKHTALHGLSCVRPSIRNMQIIANYINYGSSIHHCHPKHTHTHTHKHLLPNLLTSPLQKTCLMLYYALQPYASDRQLERIVKEHISS